MAAEQPITLPITTVQVDFQQIIDDVTSGLIPEDKFWLSYYKTGEQSVHGKVHLALNERDRNLVDYQGTDGVEFGQGLEKKYSASCASLGVSHTNLAVASNSYADFIPRTQSTSYRAISAFDIAPDGSQFAVGYGDGSVYTIPISGPSATAATISRAHLSAVTSVQFFPSSRVLLTAGVDFALSIISAELAAAREKIDGPTRITPARTLKGHSRTVTSTAIISRGRNILSASKDGSIRLWDVSSGSQIRMMGATKATGILCMSLGEKGASSFTTSPDGEAMQLSLAVDDREVETTDKVTFCGLADGSFEVFDLGTKLPVFHSASAGPSSISGLQSIAYSPQHNLVATGSGKGVIHIFDTRSLNSPIVSFTRNSASIEDLAFVTLERGTTVGLAIGTEDGLPYVAEVRPEGPSVRSELIGTDCDAIRRIRVLSGTGDVWTAGDDGVVRRYMGSTL
ncbi:hypothetical protein EIP86_000657 [Pleurotus ostreatoroseus]|nr:hypothetical protein EIP86_000657 [Pleurotus ostreatoroseus]